MTPLWRALSYGWMGVILVLSALPPSMGGQGGAAGHLLGYGILALFLRRWRGLWPAALLGWGYGFLIEGLQWALPYRSAEWIDLAANAAGVAIGLAVDRLWPRRQLSSRTTS